LLKLVISPFAKSQVKDVVQYYVTEASSEVAKRFRDDFAQSSQFLAENPGVGSLRFAHLLQEFELRTWSLHRFPFRIFYFTTPSTLNVIAVEHERRNVTASMLTRVKRGN